MPLVDYSSDSDSASSAAPSIDAPGPPPRKKPRTTLAPPGSGPGPGPGRAPKTNQPSLPPLPASFHDLYASTVRTTTRDDPTLHQGRTRQTPHIPGNWPSHIYIEWHPFPDVHTLLAGLVSSLQEEQSQKPRAASTSSLADLDYDDDGGDGDGAKGHEAIASFLLSPLGAPQPLHISLSRPLSLAGRDKDDFLRDAEAQVSGFTPPLRLRCTGAVEWHRTGESGRSFLVLRVHSSTSSTSSSSNSSSGSSSSSGGGDGGGGDGGGGDGGGGASHDNQGGSRNQSGSDNEVGNPNPELTELLKRCNSVAAKYGQPQLYTWALDEVRGGKGDKEVGEAFHVSIAWSFTEPTGELKRATERIFGERGVKERIKEVQIPVEGVKVKIGNVVTHVPLPMPGRRASGRGSRNLLGL
ncbi:poly(U)-specific 3'-to-5' RNA exonuclease [Madurella fahalii]|uniref:U6 snRNA phosphodiesterase n=1 Tax=Madurella fahalii TaxID=1157608 RepID=A0ABQ0FXK7_9PEZI